MRALLTAALVLVPTLAAGQMTYEQRAALAADATWQARVGIAAQQQAIVVQAEKPATCCQTSTQEALANTSGKQTTRVLCDVIIPPGNANAPEYVVAHSTERHGARQTLAIDVVNHADIWSQKFAAVIASDACVTSSSFADTALQSYMIRLWDIYALSPELAAAPVAPPVTPTPPPMPTPPPPAAPPMPPGPAK